jgi:arabinose-5-phosphate isomerase
MNNEISELLQHEANAILNIPKSNNFEGAVNLIYERVHNKNGKLICSGLGKAGQIALNIATTFSSTGTPAVFLHPSEAQHGDLGVIQPHDTLLIVSNSGNTRELIELEALTKKLYDDVPTILITGNQTCTLAGQTEICILTGNPEELCPLGLTPTTSTTTMTVIGDILVVLLMKKIGFTSVDYAKRHHGGYLGEKSRFASMNNK